MLVRLLAGRPAGAARRAARAAAATAASSWSAPPPASRSRRARGARAEADERLAAWMETQPIEEIVSIWERQPLFADQSDALRRGAAPGPPEPRPARARAAAAHRRPGRARAGLGPARDARACRCSRWRARATSRYARGRRADGRARRPDGHAALVRGHAGHAAHLAAPGRRGTPSLARRRRLQSSSRSPRRAPRRARRRRPSTPRPGPPGTASAPAPRRAAARAASGASNSSSVASPQASVSSLGRASCSAAAMPHGPVERARQEGVDAVRARRLASASRAGPKPPLPASLTFTASQAPSSAARAHVVGRGDRLVGGDRRWTPRSRTSASSSSVAARLLDELEVVRARARGSRAPPRRRAQAPLASSRSAGHGPIASRTAATRSASSGSPTLSLKQA